MQNQRPDPEKLLSLVESEQKSETRGKLKIFFGASAGVGKTYAMLHAAHDLHAEGEDVLIGIVETHGRPETEELVVGLPKLPTRSVSHKGIVLQEFDLDAALIRKPSILLLDEFAHSNPIGSRHPKRWQDVKELLDAGIDVHTTLNVQHLESLNDVVARITGVSVRETVPDSIFDQADEITLVDIPTDELLDRLKEGKVYLASHLKEAARLNFFKKGNLIALREMALRRTAERVDAQMQLYNFPEFVGGEILTPRLMVCVGPELLSLRLVRATKRMADRVNAPWFAVYVHNERHLNLSKQQQERLDRTMRLAEQMGAKTEYLHGHNALKELISFAKKQNITRIVVGKTPKSRWREFLTGTLADGLIRRSEGIEVTVISNPNTEQNKEETIQKAEKYNIPWKDYIYSVSAIITVSVLGYFIFPYINILNVIMIYLLIITGISAFLSSSSAILASVLSIFAFNLLFVEPKGTFHIAERDYFLTFAMMLLTGVFVSSLSTRLKNQALFAQKRESETGLLYALTRELTISRGHKAMAEIASRHLSSSFEAQISFWLPNEQEHLQLFYPEHRAVPVKEETAAKWAFEHAQIAGRDTSTMPSAQGLYVPLMLASKQIGCIGILPKAEKMHFSSDQTHLIETFATLIASSFDRANKAILVEQSMIEAESQKLRTLLLSSISQDLLAPLTSIQKLSHDLASKAEIEGHERQDLINKINHESQKIASIIDNIVLVSGK